MRVQGSKQRVRITEVDLEPSEQKPVLRIAPAAASLIWLGSIALATAIYMEWLPARALFEREGAAAAERPARGRVDRSAALKEHSRRREPAPSPVAPAQHATPVVAAPASPAPSPAPHPAKVTTPPVVPESSRTIRGSYHSDDSNWAAGW